MAIATTVTIIAVLIGFTVIVAVEIWPDSPDPEATLNNVPDYPPYNEPPYRTNEPPLVYIPYSGPLEPAVVTTPAPEPKVVRPPEPIQSNEPPSNFIRNSPIPYTPNECCKFDRDSDMKDGGIDPIVLRDGYYLNTYEAQRCSNAPNSFDFDNDGFPEHMCGFYSNTTKIFFNDLYNGTLVNHDNFRQPFTHLWQDYDQDIFVDDGELTELDRDPEFEMTLQWDDGRYDYTSEVPMNAPFYAVGNSTYGEWFSTKPPYWATQEWMKDD